MPVSVERRGDEWCVIEPGGEQVACHDTESGALAQARAINASVEGKSFIAVVKQDDQELRHMILLSSNSFVDREDETVRQKALDEYAMNFDPGMFHPLLFWHGGEPIGRIIEAQTRGPFLFELAVELPNKLVNLAKFGDDAFFVPVKKVWDAIEQSPQVWGVSIGFKHIVGDEQDKVFDHILKMESSILPRQDAANAITLSQVIR
jgi:hypothetical protein